MLNEDDVMVQGLHRVAKTLNRLTEIKSDDDYYFDAITEGIVWHDELPPPSERGAENFWGLRPIFRYRASLISGDPDLEWAEYWQLAQKLFPQWVGFSKHRQKPNPLLVGFLDEKMRKHEAEMNERT